MGCDGFHPKVPLDLAEETRREVVEFLENVERSGKWPKHACTTMHVLIPKIVASERAGCAHADVDTLVGSYEGSGGGQMAIRVSYGWTQRRSAANSLGNLVGHAEVQLPGRRERSGSSSHGSRPGEGLRARQPPLWLGLGDALQFS